MRLKVWRDFMPEVGHDLERNLHSGRLHFPVKHLTQSLANDWASYGIRVNAIAPGVFPTPPTRPLIENTARGEWLREHTPCARFGEPNEVVGAAIYLISPASKFVTGTVLVVDGGFLARGVGIT